MVQINATFQRHRCPMKMQTYRCRLIDILTYAGAGATRSACPMYVNICAYTYISISISICMYTCICIYIYIYLYIYIYMYICIRVYIYMHIGIDMEIDANTDGSIDVCRCESFTIGSPHRGRLNMLANVMHKPMPEILEEFIQGTLSTDAKHDQVSCSLLRSVPVCCSVLQGVAVCSRVLQCVAGCCWVLLGAGGISCMLQGVAGRCRALQGVAMGCGVVGC